MSRIKITFPTNVCYTHKTYISVNMINYGGHLGNDSVLTLFQDARIAFFKSNGLSEINIGNEAGIIQGDAGIQYLSEGHLHDNISIELAVEITSKIGFDIYYRILKEGAEKPIAIGKTGMVAFNYQTKRVAPVPDSFKEII